MRMTTIGHERRRGNFLPRGGPPAEVPLKLANFADDNGRTVPSLRVGGIATTMLAVARPRPRLSRFQRLLAWTLVPLMLAGPGCTRRFYRTRTDKDVAGLIHHKGDDPRWNMADYFVHPHPQSRFADPANPDKPPMPPDDPGAKCYSPNPQKPGKAGVGFFEGVGYIDLLESWDRQNRAEAERRKAEEKEKDGKEKSDEEPLPESEGQTTESILAAAERQTFRDFADPVTTTGSVSDKEVERAISKQPRFLITMEQAAELGLINSREYQTRRELLYLAALPVVLERFSFMPQLYAAEQVFRERFGRATPEGYVNRWRFNTQAGFSQTFSTGALLLLNFANQTVYNLGKSPSTTVSNLSLDFIQPLLRGAGWAVTLEPLAQAERNLLYAIRDYARFRQQFFVFVAAGQPTFIPGVQAGVQALSPGTVNLPGLNFPFAAAPPTLLTAPLLPVNVPQVPIGRASVLPSIPGTTATPQGFLSTMGEQAALINQYRNIAALRRYLELFRVYLEGGIVSSVQVGTVEQQLLQSTVNLLNAQANYRSDMDQFKQQLGLPMQLQLELDDSRLRPLITQTRHYEDVTTQYEQTSNQAVRYGRPGEEDQLRGRLRKLLTSSRFVRGTRFARTIARRLNVWEERRSKRGPLGIEELDRLEEMIQERRKLMDKRDELKDREKGTLPKKEQKRLEMLDLEVELGHYEQALRNYERRPWLKQKDAARRAALQNQMFVAVYRRFLAILEEVVGERFEEVGKGWPALPALCIDGVDLLRAPDDEAFAAIVRTALANRLDLMNVRAQLVDSWRKIAVTANNLLATLNVEYHLDLLSHKNRPFALGGSSTRHQAVINAQLPLVRIQEQLNYRTALIAYQQQRRQLQLAEDNVVFDVRLDFRQLRAAANNYHKVQKRAVELAYRQIDQALQAFSQPQPPPGPSPVPGLVGAPPGGGGTGDPAALTTQLLSAQNSLLSAQTNLYNVWITYLTTRMFLYRDMGVMPLDIRGVWIDDVANCCPGEPGPASTGGEGRGPDAGGSGSAGEQRPGALPPPRPADDEPATLPAPRQLGPAAEPAGPDVAGEDRPAGGRRGRAGWGGAGGGVGDGVGLTVEIIEPNRPYLAPGQVRAPAADHHRAGAAGGGGK